LVNHHGGFGNARVVPDVEALERIDAEDCEATLLGRGAYVGGRSAVGERNALQIVADLDVEEAQPACQIEETAMIEAGRNHVIERNLHVRNIHLRFGLGRGQTSSPLAKNKRRDAVGWFRRAFRRDARPRV
jgi:hypothetical protein